MRFSNIITPAAAAAVLFAWTVTSGAADQPGAAKPAPAKAETPKPAAAASPAKAETPKPGPSATEAPKAETAKPPAAAPAASKPDAAKPDTPEAKAAKLFERGQDALFRGQYDRAVKLLAQAVEADKTKTSYRLHLARAYRYAGKEKEAAAQLEQILKIAPDHVEAGQLLAEVYAKDKRWKDVVRVLEPLLTYRHDYPTYHMLAEAQYNLGENEKARKNFVEAIKLNPRSASDHYQLGNIYLAGNFFALAAESYRSALRLGMESPVLHYKLGSAYFNLRNYFGRVAVRTVRSGTPGTISDRWYLIEAVPGSKDTFHCAPEDSAIYQVAKALADGLGDRPDIHVLRASIYLNGRRYQQAYQMFAKIGPTVPKEDKALFYFYFAEAAFGTGHYGEYLDLLGKAIELNPEAYKSTLVDAYQRVADQYNEAGKLDKYIEYLAKAVAESPRTASLHLKLGYAYEEAQKLPQAVVQWQMVLDLEPDHPDRTKLLNLIEKAASGAQTAVGPTQPAEKPKPKAPKAESPPAKPSKPAAKKPKAERNQPAGPKPVPPKRGVSGPETPKETTSPVKR
jgi:tetratricopeptide (TPR) repeat protein